MLHKVFLYKNTYANLILMALILFSCCTTNHNTKSTGKETKKKKHNKVFEVISPVKTNTIYNNGAFNIAFGTKTNIIIDSVQARINNKPIEVEKPGNMEILIKPGNQTYGRKTVSLILFHSDTLEERHSVKFLNLPDKSPAIINYEVIRSFPHDPEAYTQGLLYSDGYLYESTGQPNRSSVRKIDPENGNVLKKKAIGSQYFGEGLALKGEELYMLTYHAQKVFVFDISTFELKRDYGLQTNEGWGLTYNGDNMISSDGSAYLYFMDPEYFTLRWQMEVCDNMGLVRSLNELEITPYGLFANIYTKDNIVLIDLESGAVKGILNLAELKPDVPAHPDYVLNGIAYNKNTDTFYVTGKQWPIMYEIRLLIDN